MQRTYIYLHIRMFLTDTLQYDTSDRFTRGYETLNRYRCNVPVPGGNLLCLGQGSSDWQEEVVVILKKPALLVFLFFLLFPIDTIQCSQVNTGTYLHRYLGT